ncbi:MAG: phosphate ABC transporter substrate-binding protein [Ilumatobacter sp.]|nr:phosphate ABC transporter substrate-binding protein [Ilumatobacter sp.]
MPRRRVRATRPLLLAAALAVGGCSGAGDALEISGSTTVNPIVVEVAEAYRRQGNDVLIDTQGGSSGGLAQLRDGQIDIAMSSKPLDGADPDTFRGTVVAYDAVGVAVHPAVVAGGVDGVNRVQLAAIFEGTITNWAELGGPDVAIFVYDKEPGRGTREVFDEFLYGAGEPRRRATHRNYAVAGANEESRLKISTTTGAIGPLSIAFIDDSLATLDVEGVAPTVGTIRDGSYGIVRPLLLVTDGEPSAPAQEFIDLTMSATGTEVITALGYLPPG